ncbi:MAG: hypothetical protein H7Z12_19910 [Rhodospirillaceae bacterium]|nr:hypothetical protein [Rhodospirillales bacterium]
MAERKITATDLTDDAVRDRFKIALRRHVGVARPWSITALAAESGEKERNLRAYQDQSGCLPELPKLLRIAIALGPQGPAFLSEILSVAGFEGLRCLDSQNDNPFSAQAALAEAVFRLAGWLADGKFDHQERREAIPAMLATIDQLNAFVAGLQAGQEG